MWYLLDGHVCPGENQQVWRLGWGERAAGVEGTVYNSRCGIWGTQHWDGDVWVGMEEAREQVPLLNTWEKSVATGGSASVNSWTQEQPNLLEGSSWGRCHMRSWGCMGDPRSHRPPRHYPK